MEGLPLHLSSFEGFVNQHHKDLLQLLQSQRTYASFRSGERPQLPDLSYLMRWFHLRSKARLHLCYGILLETGGYIKLIKIYL